MSTLEPIEATLIQLTSTVADAHTKPYLAMNTAHALALMGYPTEEVAKIVTLFFQQYNTRPA